MIETWRSVVALTAEGLASLADGLTLIGAERWSVAVVLGTVALRLVLTPVGVWQARVQREHRAIAPELERLRKKHRRDLERLREATADAYRRHGLRMWEPLLPPLVQAPFVFAFYSAVRRLLTPITAGGFGVTAIPFFVGGNLAHAASSTPIGLVLLASMAVVNWLLARRSEAPPSQKRVLAVIQLGFVWFTASMPGVVVLFWALQTALYAGQSSLLR